MLEQHSHGDEKGNRYEEGHGDLSPTSSARGSDSGSGYVQNLESYMRTVSRKPLLSASEEKRLARRAQTGCQHSTNKLIEHNLRLVIHNAKRFRGQGLDFEELIQEGTLGLIRAVEKFDPQAGYKLSTYATWWIRQKTGRALMDKGGPIRIPVHYHEQIRKLSQAENRVGAKMGREPTRKELGTELGLSPERVRELSQRRQSVGSLDAAASASEDGREADRDAPSLLSYLAGGEQDAEPAEAAAVNIEASALRESIASLHEEERFVVCRRYGLDGNEVWTLQEVATELGTHREAARKHQKRAERKLREQLRVSCPRLDS